MSSTNNNIGKLVGNFKNFKKLKVKATEQKGRYSSDYQENKIHHLEQKRHSIKMNVTITFV